MKKRQFPTAQTILILIAIIVALLTWLVPAGKYDTLMYHAQSDTFLKTSQEKSIELPATQKTLDDLNIKIPIEKFVDGDIYKPIAIPNTYKELESRPQGLAELVKSPVKGIIAAADIIFLILIIGGLIGIMNFTGAFDAGISWMSKTLKGREYILIIVVTTLIAAGGTTFGLAEETMAFYPILIPVFLAAKYDAMVGLASIFLGSGIGSMCSTINPFSTIIASDAAGINWTTGLENRLIILVVCLVITILYILRYAKRVKADPSKSLVYEQKEELEALFGLNTMNTTMKFTPRLRLIMVVFSLSFLVMIIGVSFLDWWFVEMTATFLVGAIIIGFIAKMKESVFIEEFVKGASTLLSVAFIVGIARGITILMEDGLISDTILYHASTITEGMNKGVFTNFMLFIYGGLSFFMPSSSGMAVLTMPIMSPLADTVNIGRETIVDTYQYGMGLFYLINPTSLILAALAVVKIGFNKWLKFVMPLLLVLLLTIMAFLTISVY
ncbi:YfcC family protein [Maribacter polysiphoniae]|uniref:Putative ion transporter superfamily protein YfcC n=1 Tax=Maribacter polysiphoniae TaxID=429344 RepID=A0A316DUR5_9FLAO|nr:YfcC family protein [Maribacter polysiphoniae]MBD1262592.1 YfcC family protein [Maribacter polysiphoniae]PWK21208.1 putative ion transporter superfamily protein YfcC [Maribacter polysiphoniae]